MAFSVFYFAVQKVSGFDSLHEIHRQDFDGSERVSCIGWEKENLSGQPSSSVYMTLFY